MGRQSFEKLRSHVAGRTLFQKAIHVQSRRLTTDKLVEICTESNKIHISRIRRSAIEDLSSAQQFVSVIMDSAVQINLTHACLRKVTHIVFVFGICFENVLFRKGKRLQKRKARPRHFKDVFDMFDTLDLAKQVRANPCCGGQCRSLA